MTAAMREAAALEWLEKNSIHDSAPAALDDRFGPISNDDGNEIDWRTVTLFLAAAIRALPRDQIEAEVDGWLPIDCPPSSTMGVLLYYPSHEKGKLGADYRIMIGWYDADDGGVEPVWRHQGTNHDCFESWPVEQGRVPTRWFPLPAPPVRHPDAGGDL